MKIDECEGSVSGTVAVALLEDHAVARQRVDVRRLDALEAVAAEPVGARRVERDDDDVQVGRAGLQARDARRAPPASVRGGRPQHENQGDDACEPKGQKDER